jgi:cysteinyl-tRNA synthetase
MDDDFNTAQAVGEIFKTVRLISRDLSGGGGDFRVMEKFRETVPSVGEVLGILTGTPSQWRRRRRELEEKDKAGVDVRWLEEKVAERQKARRDKNWHLADRIRAELMEQGVVLEDSVKGTEWRITKR